VLNPLTLPLAAASAVAELPKLVASATRAADALDELVALGERLDRKADAVLGALERTEGLADTMVVSGDRLIESGDKLLAAAGSAEQMATRLTVSGDALVAAAAELGNIGAPILETSEAAQQQLERTHSELERATAQITRLVELGGPIEIVGDRIERVVARLRREQGP
jgi:hypothetical protein